VLYLLGGEPLLVRGLPRLIKRAKDEGMYVALSTNGIILNERYIELLKSSVDAIKVSLDSSDPAENDALRGGFHMALRGASRAASAGIITSISCTVTEINPRALGIVELARNVESKR
jgi:MoaA/NifB/PqqE/SkfB family radical SAM enzyme